MQPPMPDNLTILDGDDNDCDLVSSLDGMTPFRRSATGGPRVHHYFPREKDRTGVG